VALKTAAFVTAPKTEASKSIENPPSVTNKGALAKIWICVVPPAGALATEMLSEGGGGATWFVCADEAVAQITTIAACIQMPLRLWQRDTANSQTFRL
jgi:hypothetical protein